MVKEYVVIDKLIDKGVCWFFLLILEWRNVNIMINVSMVFVIIFYLGFMFLVGLREVELLIIVLYMFFG